MIANHLRKYFRIAALALPAACTPGAAAPSHDVRPPFDAGRLELGHFLYRNYRNQDAGKDVGTSNISIERIDARAYRFRNEITGEFMQTWESTANVSLEPIAASLGIGAKDDKKYAMRLAYEGRKVTGTATKKDPAGGSHTNDVDVQLPSDIVDQRIDWAAVMSLPLRARSVSAFNVYDPWTGVSPVSVQIGDVEEVRVPAGTFRALHIVYRIEEKGRGNVQFVVWVTEREPRFLVREDFPNGSTTQLAQMTN